MRLSLRKGAHAFSPVQRGRKSGSGPVAPKKQSDADAAKKIAAWVDGLEFSFGDRILGIDTDIAKLWGELSAERLRPVVDTLLAATAVVHDLAFVTRNTGDVKDINLRLVNPWAK